MNIGPRCIPGESELSGLHREENGVIHWDWSSSQLSQYVCSTATSVLKGGIRGESSRPIVGYLSDLRRLAMLYKLVGGG